ncbi:NADPH:quinone reductase [Bryocella elongata]|uniref:NADPH:quinone reductase n=1 Tax=Bryocella elongata TaxID=863522 RepID=A0A1H5SV81_9BACT|nr:NAD(P)-dependent alcohol dehydrogenase [Bryocella elongata]SEF54354.1 NADPH:quinone reductase [Bryocella elongata]
MPTPKTLRLHAFGLDHLALEDIVLGPLGPSDVHVRFHAASLNYRDLMVVRGEYNPKLQMPRIPGSDAAGEVLAVGPAVTTLKPGDRVASLFFQDWRDGPIQNATGKSALGGPIDGVFATERILPASGLIRIPDSLTYEQAATLPCAALTAWNALVERGGLFAGQTVLTLGTGGVSLFALQFASAMGARVIATSSSDEKLVRAQALGASATVNYRANPQWDQEVQALTNKRGVDHVVEVGGAGTLPLSLKAVTPGGKVYVIGVLSGKGATIDPTPILAKSVQVHGIYVGSRGMFERMLAAIEANRIQPVIDRVFPLADYRAAFEHMANGAHFGKIVLDLAM